MDLELNGKRALITGGSVGIGLAIARAMAAEGMDLALVARTAGPLEEAAAAVAAESGRRVVAIPADVADADSIAAMARRAEERLGGIDVLVNCAAKRELGPPSEQDLEEDVRIKVRGYLLCARALAPGMVERGWGRIVNIGGDAARQTGATTRSVRNVAVTALSKNLADELAPSGVAVFALHPGLTDTPAMASTFEAIGEKSGIGADRVKEDFGAKLGIGRLPTGAEVADVVVFLASPRAVALNGDALYPSGGTLGVIHY